MREPRAEGGRGDEYEYECEYEYAHAHDHVYGHDYGYGHDYVDVGALGGTALGGEIWLSVQARLRWCLYASGRYVGVGVHCLDLAAKTCTLLRSAPLTLPGEVCLDQQSRSIT